MDVTVNCDWQYYQQAITKIWKILDIENYEQAKGKSVDELVADLKLQRDALLEACKELVADRDILQQDEGIFACQCLAKAPDDITEPPLCCYCLSKEAIAQAQK